MLSLLPPYPIAPDLCCPFARPDDWFATFPLPRLSISPTLASGVYSRLSPFLRNLWSSLFVWPSRRSAGIDRFPQGEGGKNQKLPRHEVSCTV
jgi:hypothetical protein